MKHSRLLFAAFLTLAATVCGYGQPGTSNPVGYVKYKGILPANGYIAGPAMTDTNAPAFSCSPCLYFSYGYGLLTPGMDMVVIDPYSGNFKSYGSGSPLTSLSAEGSVVGSDGNIYVATFNPTGAGAHIFQLKINGTTTPTFNDLGTPLSSGQTYIFEPVLASDGNIYGGTYSGSTSVGAHVVEYDISTATLYDRGSISTVTPVQQYAQTTAATSTGAYVYFGIGNPGSATVNQDVIAYNISTHTSSSILPTAYKVPGQASVHLGNDGNVYALADGTNFSITGTTMTALSGCTGGCPLAAWGLLAPYGGVAGSRENYGNDETPPGSAPPHMVSVVGNSLYPNPFPYNYLGQAFPLFSLALGPDQNLYVGGFRPGMLGMFDFNTQTMGSSTVIPIVSEFVNVTGGGGKLGTGEPYSMMSYNGQLLVGMYSGLWPLISYNPAANTWPASNPGIWTLGSALGDDPVGAFWPNWTVYQGGSPTIPNISWRPQSMAGDAFGNVYVGAQAVDGQLDGPLTIWNTNTNAVSFYPIYNYSPLSNQAAVSVTLSDGYVIGGTSILGGSGSTRLATQAYLFQYDPVSQTITHTVAPVTSGCPSSCGVVSNLVTAPSGLVWGTEGLVLFSYDPTTTTLTSYGAVLVSGDFGITMGPDGNLWGGNQGGGLFQINTTTHVRTAISTTVPLPTEVANIAMNEKYIYYIGNNAMVYQYQWNGSIAPYGLEQSGGQSGDSCVPAFDVAGNIRPQDTNPDIGAYADSGNPSPATIGGTVTTLNSGNIVIQSGTGGAVTVYYSPTMVSPADTRLLVDDVVAVDGSWNGGSFYATAVRRVVFGFGSGTKEYYVAPSPTGVNSLTNDCSSAHPCAGIDYVCSSMITHDYTGGVVTVNTVVHAAPGTYTATSNSGIAVTGCSGSATARLRFVADGLGKPWSGTSQAILQNTFTGSPDVVSTNGNYIDIVGFEITGAYANDGLMIGPIPPSGTTPTGVVAARNYIHDIGTSSSTCLSGGAIAGQLGNNSIIGNVILNVGKPTLTTCQQSAISVNESYSGKTYAGGWTIENNQISNAVGYGLFVYSYACMDTIVNNTIFHNGFGGILLGNQDPEANCIGNETVSNNILANNSFNTTSDPAIWEYGTGYAGDVFANNVLAGNSTNTISTTSGSNPILVDNITLTSPASLFLNYQDDGSGNYHLAPGSAAIDAGTIDACAPAGTVGCIPYQDQEGFSRPLGPAISIGAYEYR